MNAFVLDLRPMSKGQLLMRMRSSTVMTYVSWIISTGFVLTIFCTHEALILLRLVELKAPVAS